MLDVRGAVGGRGGRHFGRKASQFVPATTIDAKAFGREELVSGLEAPNFSVINKLGENGGGVRGKGNEVKGIDTIGDGGGSLAELGVVGTMTAVGSNIEG